MTAGTYIRTSQLSHLARSFSATFEQGACSFLAKWGENEPDFARKFEGSWVKKNGNWFVGEYATPLVLTMGWSPSMEALKSIKHIGAKKGSPHKILMHFENFDEFEQHMVDYYMVTFDMNETDWKKAPARALYSA